MDHLRCAAEPLGRGSFSKGGRLPRGCEVTLLGMGLEMLSLSMLGETDPSATIMRLSRRKTLAPLSSDSSEILRLRLVAENSHLLLSRRHLTHGGGLGLSTPASSQQSTPFKRFYFYFILLFYLHGGFQGHIKDILPKSHFTFRFLHGSHAW